MHRSDWNGRKTAWIPYFRGFGLSWERADGSYDGDSPMMDIPATDEFNVLASFAPALNFAPMIWGDKAEEEYALQFNTPLIETGEVLHQSARTLYL